MGGTLHGEQAALLPELQAPTQPAQRPRTAIWGVLLEDARHFTSCDGQQHLQVLLDQNLPERRESCPIKATFHYADTGTPNATAQVAARAAQQLRRGAEVMVVGEGLFHHHHNGHPVMAVSIVHSIRGIEHHIAPPHHQPKGDH